MATGFVPMSDGDSIKSGTAKTEEGCADLLIALIERWWVDYFPGSAVARYTPAWNTAHAAKEALKRLMVPRTLGGNNSEGSI
jgi:hypothetical protein